MSGTRITGVDAARGLALLGMAAVHLHATTWPDGTATPLGDAVAGRASALFAVLAGVGIALGTRSSRLVPPESATRATGARDPRARNGGPGGAERPTRGLGTADSRARNDRLALVVRALLLGLLGLGLETVLDAPPAVILAQYGLLFLVAVPLLTVRRPVVLFALAAVWCVGSPVLSHVLRADLPYAGPPSWSTQPRSRCRRGSCSSR